MMTRMHLRAARAASLVVVVAAAGCAHAPPKFQHPAWPPPPLPTRVVYQGGFPDVRAVTAQRSFLRQAFEAIVGLDEAEAERAQKAMLARPFGLAARAGHLYVADPDGKQVLDVDWAQGTSVPVACPKAWQSPMAVAVAPAGTLYVADAGAARVVRVENGACTELGEGLQRPTGVAISGATLYVVDPPAHDVVALPLAGGPAARFGTRGEGEGELNFPTAIAARADGSLLVVDALNFRVVAYAPDGRVLSTFGAAGTAEGTFARPKAVAVDGKGRVYVSDAQYGVVLVFDAGGRYEFAFGGSGREPKSFSLPAGLAVQGTMLFVADAYHHRVERYELLEVSP